MSRHDGASVANQRLLRGAEGEIRGRGNVCGGLVHGGDGGTKAPRRARGDRGVGSRRRPRGRARARGTTPRGALARARASRKRRNSATSASPRGGAREVVRPGGRRRRGRPRRGGFAEAPLREELVGERAGVGAGRGGAEVFRVFSLTIAEDRVGETAEGVGRGRALVGSRARRPGAPTRSRRADMTTIRANPGSGRGSPASRAREGGARTESRDAPERRGGKRRNPGRPIRAERECVAETKADDQNHCRRGRRGPTDPVELREDIRQHVLV